MDLTSRKVIKDLLKKYDIRPLKRFGQNFLVDRSVLRKIIQVADSNSKDMILEIGPGIGTLTQEIAKRANKIIAVEKDQRMVQILKETLIDFKNVEIVSGDILKLPVAHYALRITPSYKIVANLPYYIVSPVIRKFLESEFPPKEMILMVQKEVAQRICAKPPKMSILAVSVQFYAKPKIISFVSKKSFWPQPKVDSAIIKITSPQLARTVLSGLFFKIVKAGFSQPRKQIVNNLSKMLKLDKEEVKKWLLKNKIEPTQRAETLNIEDWIKLTKSLNGKLRYKKRR